MQILDHEHERPLRRPLPESRQDPLQPATDFVRSHLFHRPGERLAIRLRSGQPEQMRQRFLLLGRGASEEVPQGRRQPHLRSLGLLQIADARPGPQPLQQHAVADPAGVLRAACDWKGRSGVQAIAQLGGEARFSHPGLS